MYQKHARSWVYPVIPSTLSGVGCLDNLINKNRRKPNTKNRVDDATEQAVIAYAIEQPAHGQHKTSNELRKLGVFHFP